MASQRSLQILVLFDLSIPLTPADYAEYLRTDDWKTEANILSTLTKLGHQPKLFGVHNDLQALLEEIRANRPDLVFNLSEAFDGNRDFEPHVVSLLELLKIPYTGAGPEALRICKDKGLTKKILSYHRMQVPKFLIARKAQPLRRLNRFPLPAFIKPLALEGSEGIAQPSFAENEKDALDRIRYINEKLGVDAIVEEYIDGREIYVGVIGNERLSALPPRELFFKEVPEGEPKFATFRAKWDDAYRKKWGIDSGPAAAIAPDVLERMLEGCKKIYRVLQMKGYGRIDLRLRPSGEFVFIEANPNPSLAREDDFARAAIKSGLSYDELIAKIISLSGA